MNPKALKTLEYNKIIDKLTEFAGSALAKEMCRNLQPSTDLYEIQALQKETSDALSRIYQKGAVSFRGVRDIRGSIKRLEIGAIIGINELLSICSLLEVCSKVKAYSRNDRDPDFEDSLEAMFQALQPLTPVSSEIRRCIASEEELNDDASPALFKIRRSMRQINDKVHAQLQTMVNGSARTYLQDAVVTMRNGRYCIPVKAEHRGQIPGMIHDQSSTGSTLFVEPMAVIKLNNDLRELELKEEKEIEMILATLSARCGEETEALRDDLDLLTKLDFIFARAQLSRSMNGTQPDFNEEGRILIKKGRHPLLDKKKVVPIDIQLGKDFELLIITGPNTGGKTVALKTCGLLTLMAMSGMLIPAAEGSRISVFNNVLADIGDTQSIEQNLSTFSAHMRSVIEILEQADRHSLVLLDELGSGTDPIEGAALAEAVIQRLKDNGAKLMVTTHYQELKLYATEQPDVQNASCEFDIETLRPTYRLILGSPGKSNAFAICKGLGLSESIIAAAETLVSQENLRFEEAVSKLEETRKALEQDRSAMQEALRQAEEDAAKLREEVQRTRTDRENIMEQARLEAMRIVETTKAQSNEMISELDQLRKAKEKATFGDDVIRAKGNVKRGFRKMYETANPLTEVPDEDYVLPRELQVGDTVMLTDTKQKAVVAGKPDKNGTVFLQIGAMRTKVPQEKLRLVAGAEEKKKSQQKQRQTAGRVSAQAARRGTMELDIRGCTCDEGVYQMDAFLDRAVMSHIATVTIIHGKGTGLLRKAIHQRLKQLKYVKNFRLGTFGEGEDGVTIVSLE